MTTRPIAGTTRPVANFRQVQYRKSTLAIALLAVACNRTTPQEKAAQDSRDVAMVQAVQTIKPPVQPLRPQPVDVHVRRVYNLSDSGCDFLPIPRRGNAPILVAGRAKAVMRVNDEPLVLAADSGSPELIAGVHEKYVGRAQWAQLTKEPASLTIRDRYERVVYFARGTFSCRE